VRNLVFLPLLLLTLLLPGSARGQEPAEAEPTYYESIDVQVVNVEVFVSDKSGQRVTGLTSRDFQLLEDGRPVEITNFFAVGGAAASGETATVPAGSTTPAALPQPAAVPAEQRLHLAIVIDDMSLGTQPRGRLLKSLREDVIPRLRPQDLALVATSAGSGVEVAQGPTADKGLLLAALDRVATGTLRDGARVQEGRRLLQEIDQAHLPDRERASNLEEGNARAIYDGIRRYSQECSEESRNTLAALTGFVDTLAGLPGRKSLLYVGGGLSLRPGEALYRAWERKLGELRSKMGASPLDTFNDDLTAAFNAMVRHANGNRVTFYTLGATEGLGGLSVAMGTASWTPEIEALEKANLVDSLLRLADGTGGLASVNAGDPGPLLGRMNDDFQSYYSLGFVPARKSTGKDHKIEVTVRGRRDVEVRYRSGHSERTDRERMTDRTQAALLLDPGENPLEVALEFTRETKTDDGQLAVEVLVKFPLARLVLLPSGEFHEGKVSIWVSARDPEGRSSPVRDVTVPIRVPNDQVLTALAQNAAYTMKLVLRDEEHRIAVAVRDELGNVESAVSVPFKPGQ
jgi:VWFA-related protein